MNETLIGVVVGVVSIFLNAIVLSTVGSWRLGRVVAQIERLIAQNRIEGEARLNAEVRKLSDELHNEHDQFMRQYGDSIAALRTKIADVDTSLRTKIAEDAMWTRDTFVRRADFTSVVEGLGRSIDNLASKLEAAVLRIEGRIERMISLAGRLEVSKGERD